MDACPFPQTRSVSVSTTRPSQASQRLLDAAAHTRDFETADQSVVDTLAHIYATDRIWLHPSKASRPPRSSMTPIATSQRHTRHGNTKYLLTNTLTCGIIT